MHPFVKKTIDEIVKMTAKTYGLELHQDNLDAVSQRVHKKLNQIMDDGFIKLIEVLVLEEITKEISNNQLIN